MNTRYADNDLRSFIDYIKTNSPREYLAIDEPLSGDWQLAATYEALVSRMRMPVVVFNQVQGTAMPVIQNVCASLKRIAASQGWTITELEKRLEMAYDNLIPPRRVEDGPVRQNILKGDEVDLGVLPGIRYTESETHPYISAAHVVAHDPQSGALNISFHRMMRCGKNRLALYMQPGGHLERIHEFNASNCQDTPIAAFIGSHPLWSLGALAAGGLELDEFHVIGGLCDAALPVVDGLIDPKLAIPAKAEMALEGVLSYRDTAIEGPYGEAFGFVSEPADRPVFEVQAFSYRDQPLFQDIVPGQLEHLRMTATAVQVHLQKKLLEKYGCITHVYLPMPMTAYLAVDSSIVDFDSHKIMREMLSEQRYIKHVVLFDDTVDISNTKQTQNALAMQIQAHRDVVILPDQTGNELDPSEIKGKTTKWGLDASSYAKRSSEPVKNALPLHVVDAMDIKGIIDRALKRT